MIPAKLLKEVAKTLTHQTRSGEITWQREHHDREDYLFQRGPLFLKLRYHEARINENMIELTVQNGPREEIGTLTVEEGDKEDYGILAELLFTIQRSENRGNMRTVIDEMIKLLPEDERGQWEQKK